MTALPPQLDPKLCRLRQKRFVEVMHRLKIDRVLLSSPENVQYLTGFRPHPLMSAIVALDSDGTCLLVAPNEPPEHAAADLLVSFEAQWLCTLRMEQLAAATEVLNDVLKDRPVAKTIGIEFSAGESHRQFLTLDNTNNSLIDIEPELWQLRRRKEVDEVAMIQRAIDCTHAMYQTAKDIIEPGILELEVYNQLHAAAVNVAGEPLTGFGNDFRCNALGGGPRDRKAQEGELYILDLGPGYRGYYADNCRTFAVNRQPTDEQHRAWECITTVLEMVETTVQPGFSCRILYNTAKEMLSEFGNAAFPHHLGHGIGLYPHEAPHLNPHWDDSFAEGDIFAAEPGLYSDVLQAGIRLEQNYQVTATGVKRLTSFPLEL